MDPPGLYSRFPARGKVSWRTELAWTFPPRGALDDPARRDLNPQLDSAASTGYGGQRRAPALSSGTRRDQSQRQDETTPETTVPSRLFLLSLWRRGRGERVSPLRTPHSPGEIGRLYDWSGGVSRRLDPPPPKRLCAPFRLAEAWSQNLGDRGNSAHMRV